MASSVNLRVNQSITFTTNVLDAYGVATSANNINFVSSDSTIASLANAGSFVPEVIPQNSQSINTITGLANGTATITITINGGTIIDVITCVIETNPPASVSLVFGTPIP